MGAGLYQSVQAEPGPLSPTPAPETLSSARSEDEIQGLPFGRSNVWMPQIHHEHHPRAILRGTWDGAREERSEQPRIQDPRRAAAHMVLPQVQLRKSL